jgi:Leucine-rich repeat (LRR) protein
LEKLTVLRANNIGMGTLPINIGDMKNLQELSLNGNKIKELPSDFNKLTGLTSLSLRENDLK